MIFIIIAVGNSLSNQWKSWIFRDMRGPILRLMHEEIPGKLSKRLSWGNCEEMHGISEHMSEWMSIGIHGGTPEAIHLQE